MDEPTITSIDEDARQLHHPHDIAIVITLTIAKYTTRSVSRQWEFSGYPLLSNLPANDD